MVHDILRQCGEDMKERFGLTHWIPPYPLHLLRQSAQEKRVYAVCDTEQAIATFTLGNQAPPYYAQLGNIWESEQARAVYLNRLAVHPRWQGQGMAPGVSNILSNLQARSSTRPFALMPMPGM